MRSIRWLHISDFHLSAGKEWSQDVVLRSMCQNIEEQKSSGLEFDFVVVTGDISYSGGADEYLLAASFFDDLQTASSVSRDFIFCVPGNHDVDRNRQRLCFAGARLQLTNPGTVDALLAGGEDLETLLVRQANYREFQSSYFATQQRCPTPDQLGYVSELDIDGIRIAILGLNSAWLAHGGSDDNGKLIIGERQVIHAAQILDKKQPTPHIVIVLAHHPFNWLQDFDIGPVQGLVHDKADFFHCGHLHVPGTGVAKSSGSECLIVAAGAAFESRQFHNAYSMVTLDLLHGSRTVEVFTYNPTSRRFFRNERQEFPMVVEPGEECPTGELALAIISHDTNLAPLAYYLAAILCGDKTELPILTPNGYVMGSIDVLNVQMDDPLRTKANDFLTFKNVLSVLHGDHDLGAIIAEHGASVSVYGAQLLALASSDEDLRQRIQAQNEDAKRLADKEPSLDARHSATLFDQLAGERDWCLLRTLAERHLVDSEPKIAAEAQRYLALALANSEALDDRNLAIDHYQGLARSEQAIGTDYGNLAILLLDVGRGPEASESVLEGIRAFPDQKAYLAEVGHRIVAETGDRDLRLRIETAAEEHND